MSPDRAIDRSEAKNLQGGWGCFGRVGTVGTRRSGRGVLSVFTLRGAWHLRGEMAWSNFLMTAAVIGGLFYMTKSDVRQGASMFRRNVKTIRSWIEQGEQR